MNIHHGSCRVFSCSQLTQQTRMTKFWFKKGVGIDLCNKSKETSRNVSIFKFGGYSRKTDNPTFGIFLNTYYFPIICKINYYISYLLSIPTGYNVLIIHCQLECLSDHGKVINQDYITSHAPDDIEETVTSKFSNGQRPKSHKSSPHIKK